MWVGNSQDFGMNKDHDKLVIPFDLQLKQLDVVRLTTIIDSNTSYNPRSEKFDVD